MPHAFESCSHACITRAGIGSGTARMRRFQTVLATPVWVAPTPQAHAIPIGACHEHAMMQKIA